MTKTYLYSKEDNKILSDQLTDIVDNVKESTTKVTDDNAELFNNIKEIFEKDKKVVRNSVYFVLGKGKKVLDIDSTLFAPSPIVLVSGKRFEEIYMKQLESFIYTDKETIDTDKLFTLIYVYTYINKKQYPITILSNRFNKLRSKIIKVMNNYFNKNYAIISSMSSMVTSIKESEKEITTET